MSQRLDFFSVSDILLRAVTDGVSDGTTAEKLRKGTGTKREEIDWKTEYSSFAVPVGSLSFIRSRFLLGKDRAGSRDRAPYGRRGPYRLRERVSARYGDPVVHGR